jgi:NAD-dependent SIR2 family protein deacetylase
VTERTEAVSSTGVARRGGDSVDTLAAMIRERAPVTVLTGAGVSTASGIPDYRDADGAWKQKQPMQYREFMSTGQARRRYWARSFIGWPRFAAARPNSAHLSLAELGRRGIVGTVISQNVDGLHRAAAQPSVIDLHGRLSEVVCTECGALTPRSDLQRRLEALNPGFHRLAPGVASAADGDAMLESGDESFSIAGCIACGGVLKPNVVFFGEAVPRRRVERGFGALTGGGLLLVVGSSVMVFSGYRFCREARQRGIPVAVVNRGRTRADDVADLKIADDCSRVLEALGARLAAS